MTKPTGNPRGRPPSSNPWVNCQVSLRADDFARLKAIYPGADASRRVRELILDMLERG